MRFCLSLLFASCLAVSLSAAPSDVPLRHLTVLADYLNPENDRRKAYIEKYKRIAVVEMHRAGIPASIKLAQGILESGDGTSSLAREANNHFGMKCGSQWKGDTYYLKDDDYDNQGNLIKSCFRVYKNPEESYTAHSEFLRDPRKAYRYGWLFDLNPTDYKAWAKGLKKSGYATNPRYADLLIGIIEANKLYQYDKMRLEDLNVDSPDPIDPKPPGPIATPDPPSPVDNPSRNEVLMNNDIKMVFTRQGDMPKDVAKRFGIPVRKLMEYNEIQSMKETFVDGERIYLQPKRKKWRGKRQTHRVGERETMYDIAQLYGIKSIKLYQRNRMNPSTEPAVGESIFIRKKRKKGDFVKTRDVKDDPPLEPSEFVSNYTMEVVEDELAKWRKYIADNKPSPPVVTPPTPPVTTPTPPVVDEPVTPVVTPPAPPQPPANNRLYHVVEMGDTLYNISRRYDVTVAQIRELNGLTDNTIKIGQKLRVR